MSNIYTNAFVIGLHYVAKVLDCLCINCN